jgi:hypothetical protein
MLIAASPAYFAGEPDVIVGSEAKGTNGDVLLPRLATALAVRFVGFQQTINDGNHNLVGWIAGVCKVRAILHAKFGVRAVAVVEFASLHAISGDRSFVGLLLVVVGLFLIDKSFMVIIRHGTIEVCTQICTSFARA